MFERRASVSRIVVCGVEAGTAAELETSSSSTERIVCSSFDIRCRISVWTRSSSANAASMLCVRCARVNCDQWITSCSLHVRLSGPLVLLVAYFVEPTAFGLPQARNCGIHDQARVHEAAGNFYFYFFFNDWHSYKIL